MRLVHFAGVASQGANSIRSCQHAKLAFSSCFHTRGQNRGINRSGLWYCGETERGRRREKGGKKWLEMGMESPTAKEADVALGKVQVDEHGRYAEDDPAGVVRKVQSGQFVVSVSQILPLSCSLSLLGCVFHTHSSRMRPMTTISSHSLCELVTWSLSSCSMSCSTSTRALSRSMRCGISR
jgi:hypothetical protein